MDSYDAYYDNPSAVMTSPRHHRQQRGSYDREYGGSSSYYDDEPSLPGPYDSPPPDESSEDEFSEALYNIVQSELSDPNVSVSEREVRVCGSSLALYTLCHTIKQLGLFVNHIVSVL